MNLVPFNINIRFTLNLAGNLLMGQWEDWYSSITRHHTNPVLPHDLSIVIRINLKITNQTTLETFSTVHATGYNFVPQYKNVSNIVGITKQLFRFAR